ncbi:hypothetical protein PROFUN_01915 [Planoprotostelium fungivorum]|uniref:F-box domain-containing protein n=1 Tax=Planoprotostelium fungivorum TaxID=1890364 RepID=A0A2P6NZ12_9EUKA|nr:hypothetical protein PROFUN_01915 [Planoprotostelium fungivorum]
MAELVPSDVWQQIMLSGLSTADIIKMGQVCRSFHSASLSPYLWKMRWIRRFGNAKPEESTPVSPSQSPPLVDDVFDDIEDLLKPFELEESSLSEEYHWRHHYLLRTDVFYKRHMECLKDESTMLVRASNSGWIWTGTNENIIRAGQTNIIRGQVWIKTTTDTLTRNITLRLLMFYGPPDPTKRLEKKVRFDINIPHSCFRWPAAFHGLLWKTIPAGKIWRIPFKYEMKAMDIPDTMKDCNFGSYSKLYLRASLESKIPLLGDPKVFAFPMRVRRVTHPSAPAKKAVSGSKKWTWPGGDSMSFVVKMKKNFFQPGEAVPMVFYVLNEAMQRIPDPRQWELSLYCGLTLVDHLEFASQSNLAVWFYNVVDVLKRGQTRKMYELNGFHVPLDYKPSAEEHTIKIHLRGHTQPIHVEVPITILSKQNEM